MQHRHPANQQIHDQASRGDRAAETVARRLGSWKFIGAQTAFIVLWITANVIGFVRHWDAYPFILLNLAFSTQAAYAAPILQLAQNRQSEHDRIRAETDHLVLAELRRLIALHCPTCGTATPVGVDCPTCGTRRAVG